MDLGSNFCTKNFIYWAGKIFYGWDVLVRWAESLRGFLRSGLAFGVLVCLYFNCPGSGVGANSVRSVDLWVGWLGLAVGVAFGPLLLPGVMLDPYPVLRVLLRPFR